MLVNFIVRKFQKYLKFWIFVISYITGKMKISKEKLKDIASELEIGFVVYLHKKTLETKSIMPIDELYGDTEFWEEELEKVEQEWEDYIVIEKMESWQSFEIMERFIEHVDDRNLQEELINALNRRKPFANFKNIIESSDYREKWFKFKSDSLYEYTKDQLEAEGITIKNGE